MTAPSAGGRTPALPWRTGVILWVLFFMICAGLGYGTLNRYDPASTRALSDTREYARLVVENPAPGVPTHRSLRVLVPFLARPVYHLANGRVGTWNPVFLGILAVNAALVATASLMLCVLAVRLGLEQTVGVLGGLLLAVNQTVVNAHLAGMVDAAELCAAVLLAWALRQGRWWALVPIGVGAALAKETFVVFGAVMAATWWWLAWRRSPAALRGALWITAMTAAGLAAVLLVRLAFMGTVVSPVVLAATFDRPAPGLLARLRFNLLDADFWYGLVWLLPLGAWSLRRLPREWVLSALAAAGVALALGAYAMAGGGNVGRPVISLAGPPLSLAAAITLVRQPWLRPAPEPAGGMT
jgi:hypothetical protein